MIKGRTEPEKGTIEHARYVAEQWLLAQGRRNATVTIKDEPEKMMVEVKGANLSQMDAYMLIARLRNESVAYGRVIQFTEY